MLLFKETLLKVESKPNTQNVMVHRLVFKSEKFDRGLEEMVPCSQAIKLADEHHGLLQEYQKLQGQVIAVPITVNAVEGNAYYKTFGDGEPLVL